MYNTRYIYVGGSIALNKINDKNNDIFDDKASVQSIYVRLGSELNENISGELRLGTSLGDDTYRF